MTNSDATVSEGLIRVLVADATRIGTQLMLEALRQDDCFDVTGAPPTPPGEFSSHINRFKPNVAVIAARANGHEWAGFDLLWHALTRHPKLQAVMLLESSTHESVVEAFRAGARGIVCWDDGLDVLRKCIHAVHMGQIWANSVQLGFLLEVFSRRWVPQTVVDSSGRALLSKRELDVVRCVSEGMTNREIASHLALSEHTVKNYLFRTFDKLGVSNRAELILYAFNHSSEADLKHHRCGYCGSGQTSETNTCAHESNGQESCTSQRRPHGRTSASRLNLVQHSRGL